MSTSVLDPRSRAPGKENRAPQGRKQREYPRASKLVKPAGMRTVQPQGPLQQAGEGQAARCHLAQKLPGSACDSPRQPAEGRPPLYQEALTFDDLRHEKERIRSYCWCEGADEGR